MSWLLAVPAIALELWRSLGSSVLCRGCVTLRRGCRVPLSWTSPPSFSSSHVTALPGRSGVLGFVKRSRLGCYTGSSVWGRVKGGSGGQGGRGLSVRGFKEFKVGVRVLGETLVDC